MSIKVEIRKNFGGRDPDFTNVSIRHLIPQFENLILDNISIGKIAKEDKTYLEKFN